MSRSAPARRRQRGVVILFYMVGLLAVVGMAGFALDLGMAFLTKTRLQNALDAAALDGAKTLMTSGFDTVKATTAAKGSFAANIDGDEPTVTFSAKYDPFTSTTVNARYVKVAISGWGVNTYLSRVLGLADSYDISGEALAGPQYLSDPCGAPLGVCGNPGAADKDCSDGNGCFDLATGEITLKDDPIGPGNYGLLDMGSGGADVAEGMAGSENLCLTTGQSQTSETGFKVNTVHAVNSRFGVAVGKYADPDTYPPDLVTVGGLEYSNYLERLANGPHDQPTGTALRRTLVMPVIDCTSPIVGKKPVTVLGHTCMFLTKPATIVGVFVRIIDECIAAGGTPTTDSNSGAYRILLFKSGVQS